MQQSTSWNTRAHVFYHQLTHQDCSKQRVIIQAIHVDLWEILFCRFTAVLVFPFKFQTTLYTWKKIYIFTYLFHFTGNSINKLNAFQPFSLALFHATLKSSFGGGIWYSILLDTIEFAYWLCSMRWHNTIFSKPIYLFSLQLYDDWIIFLCHLVTLC